MNLTNLEKWCRALETTREGQARHRLTVTDENDQQRHCCLGVACKVAIADGVPLTVVSSYCGVFYGGYCSVLPPAVADWLGIKEDSLARSTFTAIYSKLNDDEGLTFREIAARVREDYGLPQPPVLSRADFRAAIDKALLENRESIELDDYVAIRKVSVEARDTTVGTAVDHLGCGCPAEQAGVWEKADACNGIFLFGLRFDNLMAENHGIYFDRVLIED